MTNDQQRVELPYAVFVKSRAGDYVTDRSGSMRHNKRKRYFASHAEALVFVGGKKELIMYRPGEAWKNT